MLNSRSTTVPSILILIFCCICATSESQIPPANNQQALEVQISNGPCSYFETCEITFSAISKNFSA